MPTDAPTSSERPSISKDWPSDSSSLRATSSACSPRATLGQQDRELVAAEPGHGVRRAQRARQPLADQLEQAVAVVVAERVVDLLEVVEVHDHHRALAGRCGGRASMAWWTRSWNSARLGSPVSVSCSAWCSLSMRLAGVAVDGDQRQRDQRQHPDGELADDHDQRREAEGEAGGGRAQQEVLGEEAHDGVAVAQRDDGGDEQRVERRRRPRRTAAARAGRSRRRRPAARAGRR